MRFPVRAGADILGHVAAHTGYVPRIGLPAAKPCTYLWSKGPKPAFSGRYVQRNRPGVKVSCTYEVCAGLSEDALCAAKTNLGAGEGSVAQVGLCGTGRQADGAGKGMEGTGVGTDGAGVTPDGAGRCTDGAGPKKVCAPAPL